MTATTENLKQLFESGLSVDDFTFQIYMIWCDSLALNTREFQKILANSKIAHWFRTELAKNEKEYVYLIQNYKSMPYEDRSELYIRCIFNLFSIFPKPLIEDAKKRELKQQILKVKGIIIEISTLNQN